MSSSRELVARNGASPRVVVLGAGFGGLRAARELARKPLEVVVVDRQNHHLFQPLLYQVATAALDAPHIASPIRKILRRQRNAAVLFAEASGFDLARKRVLVAEDELAYDYLIVATGATHSYFGHDQWREHAPGLKTLRDAMRIRSRILRAFEMAEREDDAQVRASWLSFVIVGGGPTGVEMAGAIAELARHSLARDFRRADPRSARILLLEGSQRVLPPYPPELSEKARRQLEELGVTVRTSCLVTGVDGEGVTCADGERIPARTVIWGAGVEASPLLASLEVPRDRAGRVVVEPDLSIPGHPEVFVIGDAAAVAQGAGTVPGVAPAAIQMGRHAARNVVRRLAGQPTQPFLYADKGSLATIGRSAAVAQFGRLRFSGFPAWMLWLFVHILYLVGFRSRLVVLFEWAWSWLTFQRVARVIHEPAGAASGNVQAPVEGREEEQQPSVAQPAVRR